MTHWRRMLFLGLAFSIAVTTLVYAGSTILDWDVVPAGGGRSVSGNVVIEDTIGQPVVGISQAGEVVMISGFWAMAASETFPPTPPPGPHIYLPLVQK